MKNKYFEKQVKKIKNTFFLFIKGIEIFFIAVSFQLVTLKIDGRK